MHEKKYWKKTRSVVLYLNIDQVPNGRLALPFFLNQ